MVAEVPQKPIAHPLGDEPMIEGVAAALKSICDSKTVGSVELPKELFELRLDHDVTLVREFHRVIPEFGGEKGYPKGA